MSSDSSGMSAQSGTGGTDLPVLHSLDEVTDLVARCGPVFVRWSDGPGTDLPEQSTVDGLSGLAMPGLSATPLEPEPWWQDRPLALWVGRKVHAYSPHRQPGSSSRGWLLAGRVVGRGPDHEPLVDECSPLAWLDEAVLQEAAAMVEEAGQRQSDSRRDGASS
jgi:hypothetical protein